MASYKRGYDEVDMTTFINNVNKDWDSWLARKDLKPEEKRELTRRKSLMVNRIYEDPDSFRYNVGGGFTDYRSEFKNSDDPKTDYDGMVVGYLLSKLQELPAYSSKVKYSPEAYSKKLLTDTFGGASADNFINLDEIDKKTGKRGTVNRAKHIIPFLLNSLKDWETYYSDYTPEQYNQRKNYVERAVKAANDGTITPQEIFYISQAFGADMSSYFTDGSETKEEAENNTTTTSNNTGATSTATPSTTSTTTTSSSTSDADFKAWLNKEYPIKDIYKRSISLSFLESPNPTIRKYTEQLIENSSVKDLWVFLMSLVLTKDIKKTKFVNDHFVQFNPKHGGWLVSSVVLGLSKKKGGFIDSETAHKYYMPVVIPGRNTVLMYDAVGKKLLETNLRDSPLMILVVKTKVYEPSLKKKHKEGGILKFKIGGDLWRDTTYLNSNVNLNVAAWDSELWNKTYNHKQILSDFQDLTKNIYLLNKGRTVEQLVNLLNELYPEYKKISQHIVPSNMRPNINDRHSWHMDAGKFNELFNKFGFNDNLFGYNEGTKDYYGLTTNNRAALFQLMIKDGLTFGDLTITWDEANKKFVLSGASPSTNTESTEAPETVISDKSLNKGSSTHVDPLKKDNVPIKVPKLNKWFERLAPLWTGARLTSSLISGLKARDFLLAPTRRYIDPYNTTHAVTGAFGLKQDAALSGAAMQSLMSLDRYSDAGTQLAGMFLGLQYYNQAVAQGNQIDNAAINKNIDTKEQRDLLTMLNHNTVANQNKYILYSNDEKNSRIKADWIKTLGDNVGTAALETQKWLNHFVKEDNTTKETIASSVGSIKTALLLADINRLMYDEYETWRTTIGEDGVDHSNDPITKMPRYRYWTNRLEEAANVGSGLNTAIYSKLHGYNWDGSDNYLKYSYPWYPSSKD